MIIDISSFQLSTNNIKSIVANLNTDLFSYITNERMCEHELITIIFRIFNNKILFVAKVSKWVIHKYMNQAQSDIQTFI